MGYDFSLDSKSIRTLYRRLLMMGYTKEDASNMVANLMGLGPNDKGWTVSELQKLLFLTYLIKVDKVKE